MEKTSLSEIHTRRAGLSLTEVLIAAALLLLIAISIIPLFQRAVVSNISGGEATQASTGGVRVGLESINQTTLNHPDMSLPGTSNALALSPMVLETGPLVEGQAQAAVGDERWISAPDWPSALPVLNGRALWARTAQLRNFTYADIHSGTISVTGGGIVTLGDPYYFDSPRSGSERWDIKENTVTIQNSWLDSNPNVLNSSSLGTGQRLTISLMRSY
ncbi:MAG: hypothetical protein HC897_00410 [Thermoanaerobaculia bacterium]|nr:hypothetical protein [Thermoanaerobaculia bacterium]